MGPLWPARRIPADERNYSTRKPATTCESQVNALVVRDVVLEFFGQFNNSGPQSAGRGFRLGMHRASGTCLVVFRAVEDVVCRHFGITSKELHARSNAAATVQARHPAIYLCDRFPHNPCWLQMRSSSLIAWGCQTPGVRIPPSPPLPIFCCLLPDAEAASADERRRAHREHFVWPHPACIGVRQLSIRSGKGRHRGADALSRKGAWPATNLGERRGSYEGMESRNT